MKTFINCHSVVPISFSYNPKPPGASTFVSESFQSRIAAIKMIGFQKS